MKFGCVSVGVALSLCVGIPAQAQDIAALEPTVRAPQFMRVFANAQPPYGVRPFLRSAGERVRCRLQR